MNSTPDPEPTGSSHTTPEATTSTRNTTPGSGATAHPRNRDEQRAADRHALTQLLRRLHFYAGVLVGPFLLVAAVTGTLYALSPSLEKALHGHELNAASTTQAVPLGRQIEIAQDELPQYQLNGVQVGSPGMTTKVLFADKSLGESRRRVVFVDPSSGEVRGTSVVYGDSYALPERAWLSETHRRLHLGEPGRIYSELAASWLAPVTLAGLWLWWQRRRRTGPARALGERARSLRLHSTLGVVVSLGLLFLSATGLSWSKYAGDHIGQLRTQLSWKTPAVSTALPGAMPGMSADEHAAHTGHESATTGESAAMVVVRINSSQLETVDRAVRRAGLVAPYEITPGESGVAWKAKESRRSWFAGPDAVAVDSLTGKLVDEVPFSSFPLAAKLTDWGIRGHMGFLFGLANQLLLAATGLSLVVMVVHGYKMWWLRRPTRVEGFAMGRPPVRGALRRLARSHPLAVLLTALVVVAVGWFLPLLGISLLGFLLVDSAIGSGRRAGGH